MIQSLYYLLSMIFMGMVVFWYLLNEGRGGDRCDRGVFAMTEPDPAPKPRRRR